MGAGGAGWAEAWAARVQRAVALERRRHPPQLGGAALSAEPTGGAGGAGGGAAQWGRWGARVLVEGARATLTADGAAAALLAGGATRAQHAWEFRCAGPGLRPRKPAHVT